MATQRASKSNLYKKNTRYEGIVVAYRVKNKRGQTVGFGCTVRIDLSSPTSQLGKRCFKNAVEMPRPALE